MHLRDIFKISKGTKVIFTITFSVSVLAVAFAFFYYRTVNKSEDPRTLKARELLARFDRISGDSRSIEAFPLLDSAFNIFNSIPEYRSSFETGVIYNNKCSGLLMMVLYDTSISKHEKRVLMDLSLKYCDSSISVYRKWITEWGNLSPEVINKKVSTNMNVDDPSFSGYNFQRILSRRIKSIISAQIETPRRLSVSLTNKGTIYRHMLKPDSSLVCFEEALKLWKDNRTAKSNLSVLMGGEPVKPTIIQSLFPPDKNKK